MSIKSEVKGHFWEFVMVLVELMAVAIATASMLSEYIEGLLFANFMMLAVIALRRS